MVKLCFLLCRKLMNYILWRSNEVLKKKVQVCVDFLYKKKIDTMIFYKKSQMKIVKLIERILLKY